MGRLAFLRPSAVVRPEQVRSEESVVRSAEDGRRRQSSLDLLKT